MCASTTIVSKKVQFMHGKIFQVRFFSCLLNE